MNKLNGQCPECRKPAPFCDCKSSEELIYWQNRNKLRFLYGIETGKLFEDNIPDYCDFLEKKLSEIDSGETIAKLIAQHIKMNY
jgi:hypothetical protein